MCEKEGTSKKFLDNLIRTMRKMKKYYGFDAIQRMTTRNTFFKQIHPMYPKPTIQTVNLEVDLHTTSISQTVKVTLKKYSFIEQLQDLLLDAELFGNLDNVSANEDPSRRYHPFIPFEDDKINNPMASDWYKEMSGCQITMFQSL
jgi:hypothetical protein